MATITKLRSLMTKLDNRIAQTIRDGQVSAVVGFTAHYALHLHERIEMKWRGYPRDRSIRRVMEGAKAIALTGFRKTKAPGLFWGPNGEAKFLENPAREGANDGSFARIIVLALKAGKTIGQALLMAGLKLQREAMQRVPVLTGNLRASAFTRLEQQ